MSLPATTTPLRRFRPSACVFDLDGTLVDNMPLHQEAFGLFTAKFGLRGLTPADRRALDGKRNAEIMPVLFGRSLTPDEVARYEHEKESLYRERSRGRLTGVPGLARLLEGLDRHGIGVAIATSAPRENVTFTLSELGLEHLADRVVRGDQVARGKPAPDVFVEAARRLGVAPERCVGFEDAPVGMTAVRAAGMRLVAMATTFPAEELRGHATSPDAVVRSFDELLAGDFLWVDSARN